MSLAKSTLRKSLHSDTRSFWGLFWLTIMMLSAVFFFNDGSAELFRAWQLPEYSHGPLIPVLSCLLFLRQLKGIPINTGPVSDSWPGFVVLVFALILGAMGRLIGIGDIVAYALIMWVGAVLLISFGWRTGAQFWPPVLHLVYMLPLPGALYYGVSTWLQLISSELGVWFLDILRVPAYLEGNVIDLGVYRLHVAEACSGLRYLFPILSFSYIFSVLYQGPIWHKAVLLVSAIPITIAMNSVRIAVAGVIINSYGLNYLEGFSHFFEGWVIFIICVMLLFGLAWILVRLRSDRIILTEALDLETEGLWNQAKRIRLVSPSAALISGAILLTALTVTWHAVPGREASPKSRIPYALFPAQLGDWTASPHRVLKPDVESILAADDYLHVTLSKPGVAAPIDLFTAWYKDQNTGGVHSPEVCLPGTGWEIAWLEKVEVSNGTTNFQVNRAIIQKGLDRLLVYYWYEQQGQRVASGFRAKLLLTIGKAVNGQTESAIVRLITPIGKDEGVADAEERLLDGLWQVQSRLSGFV